MTVVEKKETPSAEAVLACIEYLAEMYIRGALVLSKKYSASEVILLFESRTVTHVAEESHILLVVVLKQRYLQQAYFNHFIHGQKFQTLLMEFEGDVAEGVRDL